MPQTFAGIDVGTQGARCALVEASGRVVAEGTAGWPAEMSARREGRFEQEPEQWIEAVRAAVREALCRLRSAGGTRAGIAAIGVTSTSGTLCALDAARDPVGPAIMYNDARSRAQAEGVQQAGSDVAAKLGYRFNASFALPKILWLKEQYPEEYAAADLFLSPTDYVIGRLTGEWRRSDQTNVLKWGYDLIEDCWPDFIESELGLDTGKFPAVQRSGETAGQVTARAADDFGLPEGAPVVAGMTDGCASQVSSGAVAPGAYCTAIGTTLVIKGVSKDLILDPLGRVYCHRHPDGWWLPGGASNTGAECLAVEFTAEDVERYGAVALSKSPTGLVSYPLVGTGERFPFVAPDAQGFLLGEPGTPEDRFAAYLEGVACLERLAYETLEGLGARAHGPILSAGGGARSNAWLQIRADVLQRPVARPRATGAAMGAAILAAAGTHYGRLAAAAAAMVHMDARVEPRPDVAAEYGHVYACFRAEVRRRSWVQT